MLAALPGNPADQVAIDGKVLKGAILDASSKSALHLVQAFEPGSGLVLGQIKVDGKSNEITALPALLKILDPDGHNEGGVATGVQLPLRRRERRRATRRRGENRGQCKGKQPSRRDRENQRAFEVPPSAQKAIWTRPAHLHAGRRQSSMRRIKQAGHATALDPTLGAGQGKKTVPQGASTHEGTDKKLTKSHEIHPSSI